MRRKKNQGLSLWNTNHSRRVPTFKSMLTMKKKLSKNIQTYLDIMWLFQNRYPFQWRKLSSSIWVYKSDIIVNKARSIAVKYYTTAWNGAIVFGRLGGRASTISHGRASDKPILSCLNFFTETDIYFGIITYTYTYTYMNVYIHTHGPFFEKWN